MVYTMSEIEWFFSKGLAHEDVFYALEREPYHRSAFAVFRLLSERNQVFPPRIADLTRLSVFRALRSSLSAIVSVFLRRALRGFRVSTARRVSEGSLFLSRTVTPTAFTPSQIRSQIERRN
jgi:hypothetical protein